MSLLQRLLNRKQKMKVALDIDDVLAAFADEVHVKFNKTIKPHNHWATDESTGKLLLKTDNTGKVTGYTPAYLTKCEHNKDFWNELPILSLPCDIDFEVACYITSSPSEMVGIRRAWLKRHGFPLAPVMHSKNKAETMRKLGVDLLIDDKVSTVEQVNAKEGLFALHFQPWYCNVEAYNSKGKSITIKSLKEVKKWLK